MLEADPQAPNGVTLGGGNVRKRGRWTITPQGLACVAWPQHLLPLQALTVQLVDARAVGSVKAAMARKLNELANIVSVRCFGSPYLLVEVACWCGQHTPAG